MIRSPSEALHVSGSGEHVLGRPMNRKRYQHG